MAPNSLDAHGVGLFGAVLGFCANFDADGGTFLAAMLRLSADLFCTDAVVEAGDCTNDSTESQE